MTQNTLFVSIKKTLSVLAGVEEKLLCLMLATMIVLACLQIFLRSAFATSLLWIDPLLRYLVLWSGLLGAVSATTKDKHIALDIIGSHISPALNRWLRYLTSLFSIFASAWLTWAGWLFLNNEFAAGGDGPLDLPLWFWNGIFPLAFGLICLKFFLLLISEGFSRYSRQIAKGQNQL